MEKGVCNVTIEGGGAIDGGGLVYKRNKGIQPGRGIQFEDSSDIILRNLKISNIPTFGVDFQRSKNLTIDFLTIRGKGLDNVLGSSDGLDIEGCAHVRVSNCDIEVGDDALCLKASTPGFPCHDIRMRDCVLATTCNAFKIGTNTLADVYDVVAENIVVNKHSNPGKGNPVPSNDCLPPSVSKATTTTALVTSSAGTSGLTVVIVRFSSRCRTGNPRRWVTSARWKTS